MKKKLLLQGNQAIIQASLEAGVGFVSTYPGTPISEIGDGFAKIAKKYGLYFEYSTNEKVALEAAAGACFAGVKSMVVMKNYGLNVAIDSLMPLVYLECPLVVTVADDPSCWSSIQSEQDSRWYSYLGKIPTLVPKDSQECLEMTKIAFRIAQKYQTPVLIYLTTRVCYSASQVEVGKVAKISHKGKIKKKPFFFGSEPTVVRHYKVLAKLENIQKDPELLALNLETKGKGQTGLVTTGISDNYVREACQKLNIEPPILKLGFIYPFAENITNKFIKNLNQVVIFEELDPIIESEIKKISRDQKIIGKNILPRIGEYRPENILIILANIFAKKSIIINKKLIKTISERPLSFCSGCPHFHTYSAVVKAVGKNQIFASDIGCYMLGALPPFKMADFIVSMGASIGIGHGLSKVGIKKPIIFIGDSTFLHAGIPGLINLVHNQANVLIIIFDNRIIAMTGHQENPGSRSNLIEKLIKAIGVDFIHTSNAFNQKQLIKDIKSAYSHQGISVVISQGECQLARQKNAKGKSQSI